VGLTSRLARAEAEAGAARTEADQQLCRRKQDKLEAQLLEAKSLQARKIHGKLYALTKSFFSGIKSQFCITVPPFLFGNLKNLCVNYMHFKYSSSVYSFIHLNSSKNSIRMVKSDSPNRSTAHCQLAD
jgi:hypothetical protein